MALTQPSMPDRRPSPGLSLDLPSNNPFRNRAASPAQTSPALSSGGKPTTPRPVSRNPFLAAFEAESSAPAQPTMAASGSLIDMGLAEGQSSPQKSTTYGAAAEELFRDMTLNDKSERTARPPRPSAPRSGTLPVGSGHRPARSDEDRMRPPPRGPPRPKDRNIRGSPERTENRRPRRNSESSIMDKRSVEEEERRRRERRRERELRAKEGKDGKDGKSSSHRSGRSKKTNAQLDLIDKLDVTGIYGSGLFHHDGPFDACNPHRNRKKDHRAPMQAFPANSANMALGGAGPLNKNIDLDKFHGRGAEGFTDFNVTNAVDPYDYPKKRTSEERFNPKGTVEPVHGEESYGLGTSTFLEGAPASRAAIQRRESENEAAALASGGLQRKKSLAQRIRGISQPRRGFGDGNPRITSPEARYGPRSPNSPPVLPTHPQSAGGMTRLTETNPFFDDYDEAYEKKGQTIKIAEQENTGPSRTKAPSSPSWPLERKSTHESVGESQENGGKPSGFLNRVKSLKGGKRPVRRPS